MQKDDSPQTYAPGVCNIGREEIRKRKVTGWIGLACVVGCIVVFEIVNVPGAYRLLVALPAAVCIAGFLQARDRFCLRYGLTGVSSTEGMRDDVPVMDMNDRNHDRKKAVSQVIKIGLSSTIIAIAYYLIAVQMIP
jgi:hypothetical protein